MNKVIYRGTKTFWKTKNSVEIVVIEHPACHILEVAAYEPNLCLEAPRVYVDVHELRTLVNKSASTDCAIERLSIQKEAMTTFIFNHLFITTLLPVTKVFEIEIRRNYMSGDESEDNSLTVPCPDHLVPFDSPFVTNVKSSPIMVSRPRSAALRDMWRIPLILVRLSKSLPLSETDNAIWARFMEGKSPEQLIGAMAKALATKVNEQPAVLQRAAHAIMLPQQSPFPAPRYSRSPSPLMCDAQAHSVGIVKSASHGDIAAAAGTAHDGTWPAASGSPTKSGLPPIQRTHGSGEGGRRPSHRNVFRRDGSLSSHGSACSSPAASAASSANHSPVGSRTSSPLRGGIFTGLLSRSPSPNASPSNVGCPNAQPDTNRTPSPSQAGGLFQSLQRRLIGPKSPVRSPSRLDKDCLLGIGTMDLNDDEDLLLHGDALTTTQRNSHALDLSDCERTVRVNGDTGKVGGVSAARLETLRQRRRTFADGEVPVPSSAERLKPIHSRGASGGETVKHVRTSSGSLAGIAAMFGRADAHRVVPSTDVSSMEV